MDIVWLLEEIEYIAPRILLFILIYLFSCLSFYTSHDNKLCYKIPCISILWFPIILIEDLWYYLFYEPGLIFPTDIIFLLFSCAGLTLAFLITEAIVVLRFDNKPQIYSKTSWLEAIIISFFPVCLVISCLHYDASEFLGLSPFAFIILIIIDKILILKYNNFLRHTILKVLIVSFFLDYKAIDIAGEVIILITDCLLGYVLLKAKKDEGIKKIAEKILSSF